MHDMGRVNLCYEISLLQPIHHRDLEIRLRGPGGIDGAGLCFLPGYERLVNAQRGGNLLQKRTLNRRQIRRIANIQEPQRREPGIFLGVCRLVGVVQLVVNNRLIQILESRELGGRDSLLPDSPVCLFRKLIVAFLAHDIANRLFFRVGSERIGDSKRIRLRFYRYLIQPVVVNTIGIAAHHIARAGSIVIFDSHLRIGVGLSFLAQICIVLINRSVGEKHAARVLVQYGDIIIPAKIQGQMIVAEDFFHRRKRLKLFLARFKRAAFRLTL